MFDVQKIRENFPILSRQVYGKPLVYLDNAATTQKPLCVLDAMRDEYLNVNANVHRGVHYLSQQATDLHEAAREKVRSFINARKIEEIVFTRGTTEAINLVAASFCESQMKAGDEVLVTEMEHHSNIVSWQLQAQKHGIVVKHLPITDDGQLCLDQLEPMISEKTKIISVAHVSNVLGIINPIEEIIRIAHEMGVPVAIDGAQSVPHMPVNVQTLDCDFLAFSGHKMYGPTGIGVLYGKREWLEKLTPHEGGGEMINHVRWSGTTYNELPYKFEAGTPNFVGSYALHKAIEYMQTIGFESIEAHERELTEYCESQLAAIEGVHIYAAGQPKAGVISFNIYASGNLIHPFDIGTLLDQQGVAVRTGHHCAEPLIDELGVPGTVRVSFGLYNDKEDIDAFIAALQKSIMMLS